jgi:type III pantothenate kinase
VVGLFRGETLATHWRLTSGRATADEVSLTLDALLRNAGGDAAAPGFKPGAVLCSVAPSLTLAWAEALGRRAGAPPVEVSAETAPDLPIRYHDKSSVEPTASRTPIAVRAIYGTPAIVVDLGTATTFDCVSQDGAYLGGAIAPGVMTSAEELFRRAARLPRVELRRPERALGRATQESLAGGRGVGRGRAGGRAGAPPGARDARHAPRDRDRGARHPSSPPSARPSTWWMPRSRSRACG